jgi:poly(3-hydroxybutyrate) depolymerase
MFYKNVDFFLAIFYTLSLGFFLPYRSLPSSKTSSPVSRPLLIYPIMLKHISFFWAAAFLIFTGLDFALAQTAGCGKTPKLTSSVKSTTINGKNREYTLKIPDNYDKNRRYKFIFTLHWLGGTMNSVVKGQMVQPWFGLDRLANGSAIFVAPQGLNNAWPNSGGEDVAFMDDILKTIEADLCINEKQRFSTGFSYGAGMSFSLACSRAKVFRAVSVLSGGRISGCSGGNDPIAYMGVHGVSDNVLSYKGGVSLRDQFVRNNRCKPQSNTPEPEKSSKAHTKTVFEGCSEGHPVWWFAFDGSHTPSPPGAFAPDETWKFFSQFS